MEITDEEILNIEFYHDNKKNLELLKKCDHFYDTINNKQIILNDKFKTEFIDVNNCENIIKKLLFENLLKYKNNEITQNLDKSVIFDYKDFVYIFDNGSLTDTYIKLIDNIFNSKRYIIKLYVPFIYLCETSIINIGTLSDIINNLIELKLNNNIELIFDEYMENEIQLKNKYIIECQKIGAIFINNKLKIINYTSYLDIYSILD